MDGCQLPGLPDSAPLPQNSLEPHDQGVQPVDPPETQDARRSHPPEHRLIHCSGSLRTGARLQQRSLQFISCWCLLLPRPIRSRR